MAPHHACQPSALLGYGLVLAPLELVLDLGKLGPQPLRDGDALEHEAPVPALGTDVREAEEVERLGLPEAVSPSPPGREPAELDEARLVGVQFQGELREPLAKVFEEALGASWCSNPATRSSAKRTMTMSPWACRRLHCRAHRSNT